MHQRNFYENQTRSITFDRKLKLRNFRQISIIEKLVIFQNGRRWATIVEYVQFLFF